MANETPAAGARASAHVSEKRLWQRHMDMAKFGATPKGGVNRQALSEEDIEARRLFLAWARERGFRCSMDVIGNTFVRRPGTDADAPPVISGSHIDSQPTGGRFDGIYGVLAAFEALEAIEEAGITTRRPIEATVWTNEEGSRFEPGCMGSIAFTKPERLQTLLGVEDLEGTSVREAMEGLNRAIPDIEPHELDTPVHAFVEAHIEQGPVLEDTGKTVGVVTGIQGTRRFRVEIEGENAHAGTTPRARRKDALSAGVAMVRALEALFHDDPEDITRFTIGRFVVTPNAPSVVPGHVLFTIDFRQPHEEVIERLGNQVEGICQANAKGCDVRVVGVWRSKPIVFEGLVPDTILAATERLGLPHMHIFSGAGHDAGYLSHVCPTGMIFVPCERGISHNEIENATPSDLAAGTRVLADTLVDLANG